MCWSIDWDHDVLVLIGGALLVLGLIFSSYVHALWQVVLLYGIIMTLGANCLGLVVFVPMPSRHFVQNRRIAVAIVQFANGFARGFSAPLTGVGSAGGSWLAGWSFDLTGSYHLAFWLSIFFYACGSVAFWLLREPAVIRQ